MKRTVEIAELNVAGVSLEVEFTMAPTRVSLQTAFQSSGGWSDSNGTPTFRVKSPPFKDTAEARQWLEDLTAEVKTLVALEDELLGKFRSLEGEAEV